MILLLKANKVCRDADVAQSSIQHVEQILVRLGEQADRYQLELEQLDRADEKNVTLMMQTELGEQEIKCDDLAKKMEQMQQLAQQYRNDIQKWIQERQMCYEKLNTDEGTRASLIALQQAALGRDEANQRWLVAHHLEHTHCLMEHISVREGWEVAVETVLGACLRSICVDDITSIVHKLRDTATIDLNFIELERHTSSDGLKHDKGCLLSEYIQGNFFSTFVEGVLAASTIEKALMLYPNLKAGTSVITPEGIWLGPGWLRIAKHHDKESSVLVRQQKLVTIEQSIVDFHREIEAYHTELQKSEHGLEEIETQRRQINHLFAKNSQHLGELHAELQAYEKHYEQDTLQVKRLNDHLMALQAQREQEQSMLSEHRCVFAKVPWI